MFGALGFERFGKFVRALVLPDNGIVDWQPASTIPGNYRFTLVVDTDGINIACSLDGFLNIG